MGLDEGSLVSNVRGVNPTLVMGSAAGLTIFDGELLYILHLYPGPEAMIIML